jgi:hypothetical protein
VGGDTTSTDFPTECGYDAQLSNGMGPDSDAFVVELAADGQSLE